MVVVGMFIGRRWGEGGESECRKVGGGGWVGRLQPGIDSRHNVFMCCHHIFKEAHTY